jgi:TetR/AcrR family tetracycline transcriptional repressor
VPKRESDSPPSGGDARNPRLSPERILRVALDLTQREGLDGLSMRRLAQELDVWPMAVYRYFRDKDELLDAMLGAAADGVTIPPERGPWREQMSELLHEVRRTLGTHSSALGLPAGRVLLSAGGLRISDAGLRILGRAGLEPREAAQAWGALFGYAVGFPTFESDARQARVAIAGLPEDEYPALSAAAEAFVASGESEAQFEYGLECLLDGLEARVQTKKGPRKAA